MQGITNNFKQSTQNYQVLEYLKTGKTLTCLEAMQFGLTHNLRSRVADLKRAGYDVKSKMVANGSSYYAEYYLEV